MTPLIRYTFATMMHSQRYWAPVLLFIAAVGVSSSNDSGPLAPIYGVGEGALLVCATWFTIALIASRTRRTGRSPSSARGTQAGCCSRRSAWP